MVAEAVSTVGDQLARLALAVFVFGRTDSAAIAAATIAVSYLPWVVAAPYLCRLGDRYPRRTIMAFSDVYRCIICFLFLIPGLSIPLILLLLFALTCGEPPFRSSRQALWSDVLGKDLYVRGTSLVQTVSTASNVVGFAAGGIVVATVGFRNALTVDAVSFGVSALLVRLALLPRPAPETTPEHRGSGWAIVWSTPSARQPLALGVIVSALNAVVVGLAVPLAAELGHGPRLAGLILGVSVLGAVLGALVLGRMTDRERRRRLAFPLAVGQSVFFIPLVFHAGPAAAVVTLGLAGACTCMQLIVQQEFMLAVPVQVRSRAAGVAGTSINLAQGAGVAAAGSLTSVLACSTVIAGCGLAGAGILTVGMLWGRPRSL